jgi:putative spermidine/putrescine transport system ATP-binding protein
MRAELKRWHRELGMSFVHVTHSQEEALALADLVVVMNQGRIEQAGPPRAVFERPRTEFVARFIGAHNVMETPAGKVAVRCDRVLVGRGGATGEAAMPATVLDVEYQGSQVLVHLGADNRRELDAAAGPDWTAAMSDSQFHASPLNPGDRATMRWLEADVHVLEA